MREIRLYGSEGGGAVCSPYPYPGWSGRAGPLSPCARFLPEKSQSGIFSQLPSQEGIPLRFSNLITPRQAAWALSALSAEGEIKESGQGAEPSVRPVLVRPSVV
jgi:hypothetical protein